MKTNLVELNNWLGAGCINIFGLPFAGKDTLAHNLSSLLDAPVISGGDILRAHPDQEKVKALSQTGKLFPTDFYFEAVLPYLSKEELVGKPLILSSVGRWDGEQITVSKACEEAKHPIKAVVHLKVSETTVWDRFNTSQQKLDRSHRHDDAEHILEVRLKEYRDKTIPVLQFYKTKGLLIEVSGRDSIEATTSATIEQLHKFMKETYEKST